MLVYPIRNQIAYRLDANMAWKMLNIQEYRKNERTRLRIYTISYIWEIGCAITD